MSPIDYTLPLDQLPDPLPIEPLTKPFDVTITPPGSKSITCRAYVLAALAEGESKIIRPLRADDTDHLLNALCTLGAEARWDGEDVYIKGVAGRFPHGGNLYMGEGGTPTRFMIACACLAKEPVVIDASPRMRERPIAEGVDMLRQLGAKIEYVEAEGRLPVWVVPSELQGGSLRVGKTTSSQFVSAMLLIAPWIPNGVRVELFGKSTSHSYLLLTKQALIDSGVVARTSLFRNLFGLPRQWIAVPPTRAVAQEYAIQADASSALYWVAASKLVANSSITLTKFSPLSLQPDCPAIRVLDRASGWSRPDTNGPDHFFAAGPKPFSKQLTQDCSDSPDGAIMLAVIAGSATGMSRLTGLRTLRVKETDRIAALANELRKVGCTVETGEDWISITPPVATSSTPHAGSDQREDPDRITPRAGPSGSSSLRSSDPASASNKPIIIETYNDHRMAMAFAVLGLNPPLGRPLAIRNPKCVAKSYPGFWKDFAKLYG